ncbi:MAG: ABC transporter substrate-binding protein, partial [Candidatus Brocadiales bacterium]
GGKTIEELIRKFERQNPDIKVVEEILPATTDEQHQFYITNLEGRASSFDVMSLDIIWIPEFAQAGWLENLTERMPEGEIQKFLEGPVEADTYNRQLYAVPWYVDAGVLYYRKDLLGEHGLKPPSTLEELVASARKVLDEEKDPKLYGFIWQGKQYEGLVCVTLEFIRGNGGQVLDKEGNCRLKDPSVTDALGFMRDLIYEYKVSPTLVTTADEESTRHIFGRGRALYMRNWPYAWNLFQEEGSKVRGLVGVVAMPPFRGNEGVATLGGWQLGINRYSRNHDASWRFIEFMTNYESQKSLALGAGFKPTRKAVYPDPDLIREQPFIAELYPIIADARPRPVTPFYLMISQVLQSEFSTAINSINTPQKAVAQAEQEIMHILELEKFWRHRS